MPITNKVYEYQTFVEWIATPGMFRRPNTQKALAKKLGVDAATLSDWKKEDDFWAQVSQQLRLWSRGRTPDVIEALYQHAKATGSPSAVKLWLETFDTDLSKNIQRDPVEALLEQFGLMANGRIIIDDKAIPTSDIKSQETPEH